MYTRNKVRIKLYLLFENNLIAFRKKILFQHSVYLWCSCNTEKSSFIELMWKFYMVKKFRIYTKQKIHYIDLQESKEFANRDKSDTLVEDWVDPPPPISTLFNFTCEFQAPWPHGVWHHQCSGLALIRLLQAPLLPTASVSGMSSAGQPEQKNHYTICCHGHIIN